MKMHVMYTSAGRIVAAVHLRDGDDAHKGPRPVVKPGHHCADLEVPAEHAHLSFPEACRQLLVDTAQSKPHLKARPK